MADVFFRGGAPMTPGVKKITLSGSPVATDTLTITGGGSKTTVYTVVTGDTLTTIGAAVTALLQSSAVAPEFKLATYTNPSAGVILATGPSDGATFVFTSVAAQVGGGSSFAKTDSTVTASVSPFDLSVAANWSTGSLPGSSDVAVADTNIPWKYSLSALAAITCGFRRSPNHKSRIGLPVVADQGFTEYRPTTLSIDGLSLNIYDSGDANCDITLASSSTTTVSITGPAAQGSREPTVSITTPTHANISLVGGSVRVNGGTLPNLNAINASVRADIAAVTLSNDVTFNNSFVQGIFASAHSFQVNGNSDVTFLQGSIGSGSSKVINVAGTSTVRWNSSSIPSVDFHVGTGCTISFDATPTQIDITAGVIYPVNGATVNDRYARARAAAYTINFLNTVDPSTVNLNLGPVSTLVVS